MCLQGIMLVDVCWQSAQPNDVLARDNWGGGVLAEETCVRFLVIVSYQPEIQHEMVIFQYFIHTHYIQP